MYYKIVQLCVRMNLFVNSPESIRYLTSVEPLTCCQQPYKATCVRGNRGWLITNLNQEIPSLFAVGIIAKDTASGFDNCWW